MDKGMTNVIKQKKVFTKVNLKNPNVTLMKITQGSPSTAQPNHIY